jgi:RHS repeat-associated protein
MSCRDEKYDQFNGTLKCAYTYLADGTKVMVQDNASSSSSNGYLYLGSMVFKKTGTGYAFESTDFGGGRIINVNGTLSPYYYATDHLGSVRAITDASGNVTERNDYYAFGKRMTTGGSYPVMTSNRWKYNGKEVQTTGNVNWLDYGAREYDEVIARWTRPDPMSEKYYGTSGYTYCVDIPVIFCDPTGKTIWIYYDDNEGKKKKMRYLAGMAYSGNNNFVSSSINILNAMNGVKAGAKVLSSLTSSKYDYDFTNTQSAAGSESMAFDYIHDGKYKEGGGEIHAASLLNNGLDNETKVELSSHELFHGYQRENGRNPATVNGEVEAYLFGYEVANYSIYGHQTVLTPFGTESKAGGDYGLAMSYMQDIPETIHDSYQKAVNNFINGAAANQTHIYDKFKIDPNYKPLIFKFLPIGK